MAKTTQPPPVGKKTWSRPQLRNHGALRNLTQGTGGSDSDMGAMTAAPKVMTMSDRRLKENLKKVGQHPAGMSLFLFDFKPEYRNQCGHGRQLGFMADEVEQFVPKAVTVNVDGYKMVDYDLIGRVH